MSVPAARFGHWLRLILFGSVLALAVPASARGLAPSIDLDLALDPATRRFAARALVVPASHDFRFVLHETLEVTGASADGVKLRAEMTGRDGAIRHWRVRLPVEARGVQIEYGGELPPLDRSLDHRGVLQGLPPMTAEEGTFLPAGGAWYPLPAPLFTYRVSLSVPGGQRALVPGRLASETLPTHGAQGYRASFEFDQPVDGIDLMAGPWVVRERLVARAHGAPLRLRTYFDAELDAVPGLADGYLDDSQRYLAHYGEEIGPYPFTEFSVVASPLPTGFGMPTLTYLGARVLRLPFIRATSLGHEVLHNWWGNGVYVDYGKGNWSEGLTTFMADYAYKEAESAEAAREMRLGWLRDFAAVPADGHESLESFRSRTHGAAAAVGYGKAAMLFVMLRDLIGVAAFRDGIRAFWKAQRFQTASWDDLRAAFERASGRELGVFFEQWLERPGGPRIILADAVADAQSGAIRLTLVLEQGAPPYALRLPVELQHANRAELRWVDIDERREEVGLTVDGMPEGVRLDPDLRVWRVLDPAQLPPILRQWMVARRPRLMQASATQEVREVAASLAARVLENAPQPLAAGELDATSDPVLLVGLHQDVDAALAQAGLPPRPPSLGGRGSAQVWTVPAGEASATPPVAVISAQDVEALRALARPLPHYGGQSWLVFDGSRAMGRGVWPAPGRLIPVRGDR